MAKIKEYDKIKVDYILGDGKMKILLCTHVADCDGATPAILLKMVEKFFKNSIQSDEKGLPLMKDVRLMLNTIKNKC